MLAIEKYRPALLLLNYHAAEDNQKHWSWSKDHSGEHKESSAGRTGASCIFTLQNVSKVLELSFKSEHTVSMGLTQENRMALWCEISVMALDLNRGLGETPVFLCVCVSVCARACMYVCMSVWVWIFGHVCRVCVCVCVIFLVLIQPHQKKLWNRLTPPNAHQLKAPSCKTPKQDPHKPNLNRITIISDSLSVF